MKPRLLFFIHPGFNRLCSSFICLQSGGSKGGMDGEERSVYGEAAPDASGMRRRFFCVFYPKGGEEKDAHLETFLVLLTLLEAGLQGRL